MFELQRLLQGEVPGWRMEKLRQQLDTVVTAQALGVWCSGCLESPEQVVERLQQQRGLQQQKHEDSVLEVQAEIPAQTPHWQVPLERLQADHNELVMTVGQLHRDLHQELTLLRDAFWSKDLVMTRLRGWQSMTIFQRLERLELLSEVDDERLLLFEPATSSDDAVEAMRRKNEHWKEKKGWSRWNSEDLADVEHKRYDLHGQCRKDVTMEVLGWRNSTTYPRSIRDGQRADKEREANWLRYLAESE